MLKIIQGNNLPILKTMTNKTFDLIYIDSPYNTGKVMKIHGRSYSDSFKSPEHFQRWLNRRLRQAKRLLKNTGSIFVHLDSRESHYTKVYLDTLFGRQNFRNEIIWAYDYGGRSKKVWSKKHDVILWYTKSKNYTYNFEAIDRIPYLSPALVGPEKAARGKTPTDVWWNTIVHTTGGERVDYPTQKPLAIIRRIVAVHSKRNDNCLDFFAGSGTFGDACASLKRDCTLIDKNPQAIEVMTRRLQRWLK